jgi:hypothetical protein
MGVTPQSAGAAAAAAAHAAMVQAVRAIGTMVKVDPQGFLQIISKNSEPLVVVSRFGIFERWWRYVTSYKGLCFVADSPSELLLPHAAEIIQADETYIPGT